MWTEQFGRWLTAPQFLSEHPPPCIPQEIRPRNGEISECPLSPAFW